MAEKIAIIGASDFQNPLILKAKEKGYETHVFAWKDGAVGERTADYFYPVSITEKEEILRICQEIKPAGIVTIGSDLAVVTVNYVAEQLGLRGNGPENTRVATNKYEMRRVFEENGDPSPRYRLVGWQDGQVTGREGLFEKLTFPLIVKPVDRSGSRGITRLESLEGFEKAVETACGYSFAHQAVVEEFIEGEEFSVEFISYEGQHHFLALTKKFTTGAPHFIETGHVQPARVPGAALERVKAVVSHALDTLHVVYGPSHAEVKIGQDGQVTIIEIGARMGGDCIGSDLVPLSTGYDYVGMTVDIACGKPLSLTRGPHHQEARIRFVCSPSDLEEIRKIQAAGEEQVWRISEIEPFDGHAVVDSSTRYGYMITVKDTIEKEPVKPLPKEAAPPLSKEPASPLLSFVIPCYGSEQTIEGVVEEIRQTMEQRPEDSYEIILVNDCSPDGVWEVIKKLAWQDSRILGVNLARNFGQHGALMAGYGRARGAYIVSLDDDGQTPADEVFSLLDHLTQGGYDLVYGVYEHIQQTAFRRFGTWVNEKMSEMMIDKPKGLKTTSYFVARRFLIQEMLRYQHSYTYIGGLIFRSTQNISTVPVKHRKREVGHSGYNLGKLFSLWFNGFTAFSVKPLRAATIVGVLCALFGVLFGCYTVITKLMYGSQIDAGWSSIITAITFIGGLILFMLGLVGEYIGRIYICINQAPQYVVRETVGGGQAGEGGAEAPAEKGRQL